MAGAMNSKQLFLCLVLKYSVEIRKHFVLAEIRGFDWLNWFSHQTISLFCLSGINRLFFRKYGKYLFQEIIYQESNSGRCTTYHLPPSPPFVLVKAKNY
jgi:hypothetical protein